MDATQLVTQSYYLSDVVSRELETVTGSQLSDGIEMLNEILDEKSASGHEIPFNQSINFTGVPGQEEYFIENLIDITSITFVNQNVRYSMRWYSHDKYHGSTRILNINTFPGIYTFNRVPGGCNVYIYFNPDLPYQFEIWGKFSFVNVNATTDLSIALPNFFISYLKYALASRICQYFNIEFAPQKLAVLNKKEKTIFEPEPEDLSIKLDSKFNNNRVLDYAAINIYRGIWPS